MNHIQQNITVLQDSICSCEGVLREKNQSLRAKKDKINQINSNIRDANAGAEHIKKRAEKIGNIIGSVVFIGYGCPRGDPQQGAVEF